MNWNRYKNDPDSHFILFFTTSSLFSPTLSLSLSALPFDKKTKHQSPTMKFFTYAVASIVLALALSSSAMAAPKDDSTNSVETTTTTTTTTSGIYKPTVITRIGTTITGSASVAPITTTVPVVSKSTSVPVASTTAKPNSGNALAANSIVAIAGLSLAMAIGL
jgi:hypothetical protein